MGICNGAKSKNRPIKSKSLKPEREKVTENIKKEIRRTSSEVTVTKNKEKHSESKTEEKGFFNNDTDIDNINLKHMDINKTQHKSKDDLFKPSTTIERIINQTQPKPLSEEERLFIFNISKRDNDDLYFINEFHISASDDFSTDSDYDHIIHNRNIENKIMLSSRLLSLKERRWNRESIALSDMIKENRSKVNMGLIDKYFKAIIQLQEHFNWLIWSLSYYYYCAFYCQKAKPFSVRDKTLPFLDSAEWLNGFEWKGLFIRVQSKHKSTNMFKEMKGLKYAFSDYIQLIQSNYYYNQKDKDCIPLLSNELIFPLMAYGEFCGLILYGTTCINKYTYEEDGNCHGLDYLEEKNVFDLTHNKLRLSIYSTNQNANLIFPQLSQKSSNKILCKPHPQSKQQSAQKTPSIKPKIGTNDISRIDKNSIYSLNISQNNINNDICLKHYSLNDLSTSKILSKIKAKNIIKVLDDLVDNTTNKEKFKFMLINAYDLIPDLFQWDYLNSDNKDYHFISFDNKTKRKHLVDWNSFKASSLSFPVKTPIEVIENEYKMKINIKTIKTVEAKFEGLLIKIIYNEELTKNINSNGIGDESFESNINKQFASKIIKLPFMQNIPLVNLIKASPEAFTSLPETRPLRIDISNENVIQYQLLNPLKQGYSLIRQISNDNRLLDGLDSDYFNKSNYIDYFNLFWKKIDSCYSSIRTIHHLKVEMKKYGINSSLLVFAMPLVQNKALSNLIKISLFAKAIKCFVDYHESSNLMIKFLLYEINHSIDVLREPGFDFLSKNNCLKDIRKEKIYYLIKSILSPSDIISIGVEIPNSNGNGTNGTNSHGSRDYVKFIMEQLSFFIFVNRIKWKRLDDIMGFDLLKQSPLIYEPKSLLKEFIQASRQLPFVFLSAIEESLKIVIEPFVKFKASIALEVINDDLKLSHLTINDPMITSFINPKEISSFLLVRCLCLSHSSSSTQDESSYPKFNSFKGSMINVPQFIQAKVKIDDYIKANHIDLSEDSRFDKGTYHNSSSNNNGNTHFNANAISHMLMDNVSIYSNNIRMNSKASITWKAIKSNIRFALEPIVYKMKYQFQKFQYDSYLKPYYSNSNIESIKEWKGTIESMLLGVSSCNAQAEEALIKCYYILFILYFYIDDDLLLAKSSMMKMREVIRGMRLHSYSNCAIVNLFEGLISDKYIDSEEFFSKALIFSFFQYGEPKGKRMNGHPFYLFPLWKLARQTCILESQFTNEHFKELFHAQDFNMRLEDCTEELVSNYYNRQVKYSNKKNKVKGMDQGTHDHKDNDKDKHLHDSEALNNSNDEMKEMSSFNDNFINNNDNENNEKDYSLSESNISELSNLKIKPFCFPPTSDTKTSYSKFFHCNEYIVFILQMLMQMGNDDSIRISEEYLSSIDIKPFLDEADLNKTMKSITSPKILHQGKGNNQVLSHYVFCELMKKLSYRPNCPNGTVISFGKNSHMETCHDYYEMLSLPRVLFKLKDEVIDSIYSGWEHSIAIDRKSNCLAWGRNHFGQCGVGIGEVIKKPTRISFGSPLKIKAISCGNDHSLALNDQGVMYSFGNCEDGVLGIDTKTNQYSPTQIPLKENIVSISSGTLHNIALSAEGKVYTWGSTKGGQLGLSQTYFNIHPDQIESVPRPTLVSELHSKIIKIASGEAHSLALTENMSVYSWGFGSNGQLGLGFCEDSFEPGTGMTKSRVLTPQLIPSLPSIIDIQSGKTFSMFITNRRELFACGVNDLKQLGIEEEPKRSHLYHKEVKCYDIVLPTPIECFLNMKVKKISCGEGHCLAIIQDLTNTLENVWTWGNNHFGQLGIGNQIKSSLPKPLAYMMHFKNSYIADISCGGFHSLILLKRIKKYDEEKEYDELERIIDRIII